MSNLLQTPIEYLKGVGPNRGDLLRKELGIYKYEISFIFSQSIHRPHAVLQNQRLRNNPAEVQIIGKIINIKTVEQKRGKRLVATFTDDTGSLELVWFHSHKWIRESLQLNVPMVIFGKVNVFNNTYTMPHPEMELLKTHEQSLRSALQPVYPSTEALANKGVTNRVILKMMEQLFLETRTLFAETLPDYLMAELKLVPKNCVVQHPFPTKCRCIGQGAI
jgi:ATP-dependent DNA helicase RecG